jgi:hypothetical protein
MPDTKAGRERKGRNKRRSLLEAEVEHELSAYEGFDRDSKKDPDAEDDLGSGRRSLR